MNEDLFDDTELDRWLRDNAGRYNRAPAPDGWDTPSNAVWEGLRAGLDRRKKRRRYGWLWLFLLGGLLAGGLIAYRQALTPAQRAEQLTLPTQPPAAPSPKERPPVPVFDPQTNARSVPAGRTLAGNRLRRASAPTANPPAPAQAPVSNSEMQARSFPVLGRLPQYSIPALRTFDLQPGSGSRGMAMHRSDPSPGTEGNTLSPKILILNATKPPVLSEEPLNRTSEKGAASDSTGHSTSGPGDRINRPGLYAGPTSGIFYTSRILRSRSGQLPNGQESGAWAQAYGVQAGLLLGKRWALETGLQLASVHLSAQRTIQVRYQVAQEQFDAQTFAYRSAADQTIETSFGAMQMRMNISREPNRPIANQEVLEFLLRTDERVHYLRTPVALRWRGAAAGRWRWSLGAGLGINFENGYDLEVTAARANRPGVRNITARRLRNRAAGLAPMLLDAQLDARLHFRLARHWSLQLIPEFRYGLSSMYRNGPFRSLAVMGGMQVGLFWTGNGSD